MILVPIASDQSRTHFPKLTVILILLTSALFFVTFYVRACSLQDLGNAAVSLPEIEHKLMVRYLEQSGEENPRNTLRNIQFNPVAYRQFMERFREAMENGEVAPLDSEEYLAWKMAWTQFQAARKKDLYYRFGYVPEHPNPLGLVTSLFLHGDFWHLFWNMYFFWLVGISLEDIWGRKYFLLIYLAGGIVAGLVHHLMTTTPDSPLIGASGAIAALMGAYTIRFRHARLLFAFFKWRFWVPAWIPLSIWILREVIGAVTDASELKGIAGWTHVGGFFFGVGLTLVLYRIKAEETFIAASLKKQEEKDAAADRKKAEKKAELVRTPELEQAIEMRKLGRLPEARELLKSSLAKKPNDGEAWEELLRVDFKLNDLEAASRDMAGIIEMYLQRGNPETALDWYREMVKLGPRPAAAGPWMMRVGQELQKRGEWELAINTYHGFAANLVDHQMAPKALFLEGMILAEKLGRPKDALVIFDHLCERYPAWMPDEISRARESTARKLKDGIHR